jgi:putative oxidoreductase
MIDCIRKIDKAIDPLRALADKVGAPLLYLGIRLFMAQIFFASGWLKFKNFLNHDWGSTIYLFKEVHPIPGVPPHIAAIAGTTGELGLSTLLALGLFGRFAAAGLIVMTCVIQFLVPASYGIANPEHYYWMLLLAVIFVRGPGIISLDGLLRRCLRPETPEPAAPLQPAPIQTKG